MSGLFKSSTLFAFANLGFAFRPNMHTLVLE
jgi:hypothetical protein